MTQKTQNESIKILNNLQTEVATLRKEVARIEENVLKERLKAIEENLAKNHLKIYAQQRTNHINKELDQTLREGCENKPKCYQKIQSIVKENTAALNGSPQTALADIEQKIQETQQLIEKTKGHPCENCFQNFGKILKREKRAYKEIILVETTHTKPNSEALNIPFLIETWFEPLSNNARLKILDRVYAGKKSFSELSRDLGLKAGHLAFHLRKLTTAKLIAQEASKGDYVITERGVRVFKWLLTMQNEEQNGDAEEQNEAL